jgi:hypothetical protein
MVYHSLHLTREHQSHTSYEGEWLQSVRSIRRYNTAIAISLYLYGDGEPSDLISRACATHDVSLHRCGSYIQMLASYDLPAHVRDSLSRYPVLHKFAPLAHLPHGIDRVLYLDCDTFAFRDIGELFEKHADAQLYARAEPQSLRTNGDPTVDNHMQALCDHHCRPYLPPYNLGVCLFNHSAARSIGEIVPEFLGNVYRFMHDIGQRNLCQDWRADVPLDGDYLTYPPSSVVHQWIVEQVAAWFTWARLGLTHARFDHDEIRLGRGEHYPVPATVLCHYYHMDERMFFDKVQRIEG